MKLAISLVMLFTSSIIFGIGLYITYWVLLELNAPSPMWFIYYLYIILIFITTAIDKLILQNIKDD